MNPWRYWAAPFTIEMSEEEKCMFGLTEMPPNFMPMALKRAWLDFMPRRPKEDISMKDCSDTVGLEAAITRLVQIGENNVGAVPFGRDESVQHFLISPKDGQGHVMTIPHPPVNRHHTFDTFAGFVDFLTSPQGSNGGKGKIVVFVQPDMVVADLNYGSRYSTEQAVLSLHPSPEFREFGRLTHMDGVNQKMLWRALVTDLYDCFDSSLLLQVSALKTSERQEHEASIDDTGLIAQSGGTKAILVSMATGGAQPSNTRKLNVEWTYNGPMFLAFDDPVSIPCRLEVAGGNGFSFRFLFHPRGLERITQDLLAKLVLKLKEALPEAQVQEGASV